MTVAAQRQALIEATLERVRAAHALHGPSPQALQLSASYLAELAERRDLFNFEQFPLPADGQPLSTRYELAVGEDQQFALYLQALRPGKQSVPHDHGTWVVVVAIEGEELNRIYRRIDDLSRKEHAQLQVAQTLVVRPGHPALFRERDIHSIHVTGEVPALHFHLYGRALETLRQRKAYDLDSGQVTLYNKTQWRPSVRPT